MPATPIKILICAFGSHGDVLPFIAIGRELQRRGHEVRLYASANFEHLARKAGLDISPIHDVNDYEAAANNPDFGGPVKAWRNIAAYLEKFLRLSYRSMAADIKSKNCIVIGSSLAFSVRSLREIHRIPAAIVHLQPAMVRSELQLPRLIAFSPAGHLPRFVTRLTYSVIDRLFSDPIFGAKINQHRLQLGLPPVHRIFHKWVHDSDIVIGMFPEWFAAPQSDWPAHIKLTNFPLYDASESCDLAGDVEEFLSSGEPPVCFTAGTHTTGTHNFFSESIKACQTSNRRGILLTRNADQIPASLPHGIVWFDYVPYGQLLPRLAAIVHNGGIGSLSQALRAGVPQLVRPTAFDQFDNAYRAVRLGVAYKMPAKRYEAPIVTAFLDRLLHDELLKVRCRQLARKVESHGVAQTCDLILNMKRFTCSDR